jgi:catechol 2,3-dioxygenase-like lactoylglutathione lyase family enzyme
VSREFRFVYSTGRYDQTVTFLRDMLELPVVGSWDRPGDDRGTLFGAAAGMIEVLENAGLERNPSDTASGGPFAAIEVDDVDALHARLAGKSVPVHYPLADMPWGHRGFSVLDPNGVEIAFFSWVGRGT